jgi:hypothetical protein
MGAERQRSTPAFFDGGVDGASTAITLDGREQITCPPAAHSAIFLTEMDARKGGDAGVNWV